MKHVLAPEVHVGQSNERRVFLAGGITGAPDWQGEVVRELESKDSKLVVFNPRQKGFDVREADASKKQIAWEHRHLNMADAISFWFPYPAKCMITLFELGAWMDSGKKIIVGVHPDYERRLDVEQQLSLYRPDIQIVYSLSDLVFEIKTLEHYWEMK